MLFASAHAASALTVDFSGAGTSNTSAVSQTFGDTAQVDLSYRTLNGGNNWGINAIASNPTVRYWATPVTAGEEDIYAWSNGRKLELKLTAAPLHLLTRVSFRLGPYPNVTRNISYRIYDGLGTLLTSAVNAAVPSAGLVVALNVSAPTIVFQMGDTSNVGLRSIEYDVQSPVSAVPVPPALPLLVSGLFGMGLLRRRKTTSDGVQPSA